MSLHKLNQSTIVLLDTPGSIFIIMFNGTSRTNMYIMRRIVLRGKWDPAKKLSWRMEYFFLHFVHLKTHWSIFSLCLIWEHHTWQSWQNFAFFSSPFFLAHVMHEDSSAMLPKNEKKSMGNPFQTADNCQMTSYGNKNISRGFLIHMRRKAESRKQRWMPP